MYRDHHVALVLPCLNEEAGLARMLPQVPVWVDDVIIVDNGSTDGTTAVAARLGARIVTEPHRGYGRAYRAGLLAAEADWIVAMDADTTYPLSQAHAALDLLADHGIEFVNCARFPLDDRRVMRRLNRWGNRLLTLGCNGLFGLRLRDAMSGMWVMRRDFSRALLFQAAGIPFSLEIKLAAFGVRPGAAAELHIPYAPRVGTSKLMPMHDGLACLRFLLARRLDGRLRRSEAPRGG